MIRETVKDDVLFTAYLCPTCRYISEHEFDWFSEFGEGDLYDRAMEIEAEQALEEKE